MKFKDINNKEYDVPISEIYNIKKFDLNDEMIYPIVIETADESINVDYKTMKKIDNAFYRENETIIGWYNGTFRRLKVVTLINNITQLIVIPRKGYAIKYVSGDSNDEQQCFITKDQYEYLQKRLEFDYGEKCDG